MTLFVKNKNLFLILMVIVVVIIVYLMNFRSTSYIVPLKLCDVDGDSDCDDNDFAMFENVLGECIGGNYNRLADADHDGCITLEDQQQLFPTKPIKDTARICQIEFSPPGAPGVSYTEKCQKIIEERYSHKKCTFEFGPEILFGLGACRDCFIDCT